MARITGKEAQGLMAAYARVHAPEIKEDVSEEILSEETSLEEELQDLSEEELQEILGALRKAGSAIGSTVRQGAQAAGGAINKAKEVAGNVKTAVGNEIQKRREQVTDIKRGGISQLKQGNEARKDIAQTRDKLANQTAAAKSGSVDAQAGMNNDPGKTRVQLAFKEKQRQKQLGTYQKPKTAQELARERIAAGKNTVTEACVEVTAIPVGTTVTLEIAVSVPIAVVRLWPVTETLTSLIPCEANESSANVVLPKNITLYLAFILSNS